MAIIEVITNKEVKEISDIICDSCGKSCSTDYGFEYMKLNANWGFMSNHDLERWEAQICENCVITKLGFIRFTVSRY